jgi:hypothetical protein
LEVGEEGGFKLDWRQDCDPGKQELKGAVRTETYWRHYCQQKGCKITMWAGGKSKTVPESTLAKNACEQTDSVTISIKLSAAFFEETDKATPKIHMNAQRIQNSLKTLKKKEIGQVTRSNVRTSNKATVIKSIILV